MRAWLKGGPFNGQVREVAPGRRVLTFELRTGLERRQWTETLEVEVEVLELATYVREGESGTFRYAPGHYTETADERPYERLPDRRVDL